MQTKQADNGQYDRAKAIADPMIETFMASDVQDGVNALVYLASHVILRLSPKPESSIEMITDGILGAIRATIIKTLKDDQEATKF